MTGLFNKSIPAQLTALLTFYTRAFSLDLKEPSKRADRRRLLQGFGIDGQFGFRAKDHEILELLTEDLASALVDASEAGWTLLNVTPDALDLSPNKVYRYAPFALEWRPGSARTVAQAREELEGLLPVAARAARAWRVDTDRPTRLAALARSPTVSDEVNWRATHRLLTAHAKSDAARELTRSLDGLSEATRMACVTWGTCRNLDDGTHAALLHDVVTKGPAAMVDALVARLEKEGVGAVHASALKALSARGVDLSAFKRKADAAGEASGGQLSVADAGTLGALSEAAPTDLGGALTRKDRGGSD